MERVNALINKLQEQAMEHATAADLLNTVQLLQAELVRNITAPAAAPARTSGTAKVAVVMPAARGMEYENANGYNGHGQNGSNGSGYANGSNGYQNGSSSNGNAGHSHISVANPAHSRYQPVPAPEEKPVQKETPVQPAPPVQPVQRQAPEEETRPILREAPVQETVPSQKSSPAAWPLDPLREVPTLSQQQPRELNDVVGQPQLSLNDRLRSGQAELADVLTEAPLRDLKKAIGLNDRYVFVNELFRGDEAMYERSLKTINAFRILPEAEYWVERELKTRLGWDDNKHTTQQFYQLVKRRFS
ncbi:MAG: hypothetical protein JST39_00330 [Bacteroidetes bacterium]|nr:hypothetical protein [Bacteroidota bacterium]